VRILLNCIRLENLTVFYRFADRDMMMRYLGTGVGHRQSEDFPREVGLLKNPLQGEFYVDMESRQHPQSSTISQLNPTTDVDDEEVEDSIYSDNEEFFENIYEP
jgi:hypothetical protein